MPNPSAEEGKAPFVCWLSLKEMSGAMPFIALPCGCVFSESAVRAVLPNLARPTGMGSTGASEGPSEAACPNCTKVFDPTLPVSVHPIYPPQEVQDLLLEALYTARAAQKANKKRKKEKDGKENMGEKVAKIAKVKAEKGEKGEKEKDRSASGSPAPGTRPSTASGSLGRSVQEKLAESERKRLAAQEGMSDAVKSMFRKKEPGKKGDVADFFGRTFNRVSAACLTPPELTDSTRHRSMCVRDGEYVSSCCTNICMIVIYSVATIHDVKGWGGQAREQANSAER